MSPSVLLLLIVAMLLGLLCIGLLYRARGHRAVSRSRGRHMPLAERLLAVMCYAAKSDGQGDPQEAQAVADAIKLVRGQVVPVSTIRDLIAQSDSELTDMDFHDFSTGLSDEGKETLPQGAVMVVESSGGISAAERRFLDRLAAGLLLQREVVDAMLRDGNRWTGR